MLQEINKETYEWRAKKVEKVGWQLFYAFIAFVVIYDIMELVFQFKFFQSGKKQILGFFIYCVFYLWKGIYLHKKSTILWAIIWLIIIIIPIVFKILAYL